METFRQIVARPVWDGDLVSKTERDRLVKVGVVFRKDGYNCLSALGVQVAVALGLLREFSPSAGERMAMVAETRVRDGDVGSAT